MGTVGPYSHGQKLQVPGLQAVLRAETNQSACPFQNYTSTHVEVTSAEVQCAIAARLMAPATMQNPSVGLWTACPEETRVLGNEASRSSGPDQSQPARKWIKVEATAIPEK